METIAYILKANLFLLIIYLFYFLLFRKETFHKANRYLLIIGAAISLILPIFGSKIAERKNIVPTELQNSASMLYFQTEELIVKPSANSYSILEILHDVYWIGLFVSLVVLSLKVAKTMKWHSKNKKTNRTAFSFFGKIFIDQALSHKNIIEKHEKVHTQQYHFLDLVFLEILQILFWFNPIIYFYKKSLTIIHEFLADKAASQLAKNHLEYASLLVSKQFGIPPATIFTQHFFNHSTLKSRIIMLSKKPSSKISLLKFTIFAPLFILMLGLSSFKAANTANLEVIMSNIGGFTINTDQNSQVAKSDSTQPTSTNDSLDNFDEQPEFPGGIKALYTYLGENIKYPQAAQEANVSGKVFVKFVIKSNGNIGDIKVTKSVNTELDNEAKRVVQNMPSWTPARQNGKPVSVYYNLPISFRNEGLKASGNEPLTGKESEVVTYKFDSLELTSGEIQKNTIIGLKNNLQNENNKDLKINKPFDKALIFIDGIEVLDKNLKSLSPASIESMEVLKDEKAVKTFGPRAINGVILIKTKKKYH